MPFLLPNQDGDKYLFYVGLCRNARAPGQARYIIVSLRGDFTFTEAMPFIMHSRFYDTVPYYGNYFANELAVNTMGMSVEIPLAEKFEKIKYYIDHYNIVRHISQYEWNIARHDVHQFVAPEDRTKKVFGDYLTPAERRQALRDNDLLQVITVTDRADGEHHVYERDGE